MYKEELRQELIKWYDRGASDILKSLRGAFAEAIDIAGDEKMSLLDILSILEGFVTAKDLDKATKEDK